MTEKVTIGGKEYGMRASALVPRLYRASTGRDAISDMAKLQEKLKKMTKGDAESFAQIDLEIFENIAWAMCYAADKENTPDNVDDWLDSIEGVFSIYEALPQIFKIWDKGQQTTAIPAKK